MGLCPSKEQNPVSANEASKINEEVNNPTEVLKKPTEERKKSKDEQQNPLEPINQSMEKSTEELEKPKDSLLAKASPEAKKVPQKYENKAKEDEKRPSESPSDNKMKKYLVEKGSVNKWFKVSARDLAITWGEDKRFWCWKSLKDANEEEFEVASLLKVCWLEIHGRFETSYLTPGVMYEVVFVVMVNESGYGWDSPVNLRLKLVDGSKQEHEERLQDKPKGQWIELKAGEFSPIPGIAGEMEFSLYELGSEHWKGGLVVKGVVIRPIKQLGSGGPSQEQKSKRPKESLLAKASPEAKKVPQKYETTVKEDEKRPSERPNDNKMKVEKGSVNKFFKVSARDLAITWGEDKRFWCWKSLKDANEEEFEVASLLNVCWLEIHGRFKTSHLTPGVMYEVVFVVMVNESGYGWDFPVNLRLKLVDGSKQEHEECLHHKPKGRWIELKAGEFFAMPGLAGEMEFSLYEYGGGHWKRGLVVKGAVIRPKKQLG